MCFEFLPSSLHHEFNLLLQMKAVVESHRKLISCVSDTDRIDLLTNSEISGLWSGESSEPPRWVRFEVPLTGARNGVEVPAMQAVSAGRKLECTSAR